MLDWLNESKKRKPFSINIKRIEWLLAAGRDPELYFETGKFYKTSYCRKCGIRLIWRDGSYDFDHKNNKPSDSSQSNCYLVCKNCHGKATKLKVVKKRGLMGEVIGHKTIKLKVGYKKNKK